MDNLKVQFLFRRWQWKKIEFTENENEYDWLDCSFLNIFGFSSKESHQDV